MSRERGFCPSILLVLAALVGCSDAQSSDSLSSVAAETAGASGPGATSQVSNGTGPMASGSAGSAGVRSVDAAQRTAAGASSTAPTTANAGTPSAGSASPALTPLGPGMCCPDGKCLCRAEPPAALTTLTADKGPHNVMQYEIAGVGCVFYPTDAPPPYAAVAIADGFGGSGGCDSVQTEEWGPLYASHGIVAMLIETGTGDQASARGEALINAIAAFKAEQEKSGSPLFGKLAGRYGTSGFSTGGGGTTFAAHSDMTLLSSVAIMPWGPTKEAGSVPTLVVCGDKDGMAPCSTYGNAAYMSVDSQAPKMRVTVTSEHNGEPSAASGATGAYALAFQKLFLEGDERWRPLLVSAKSDETTIK